MWESFAFEELELTQTPQQNVNDADIPLGK